MLSKTKSMAPIIIAKIKDATSTKTELLCNSLNLGQVTLFLSSSTDSTMNFFNFSNVLIFNSTGGETRTPNQWFWRPLLYQLSYTRVNGLQRYLKKFTETNAFLKKLRNAFESNFYNIKVSLGSQLPDLHLLYGHLP